MRGKIGCLVIGIVAALGLWPDARAFPEERFGPWLYYAPYYFPRHGACEGFRFGPESFVPQYETPPPLTPGPPLTQGRSGAGGVSGARQSASVAPTGRAETPGPYNGGSLDPRPRMSPMLTPEDPPALPHAHGAR